MTMPRARARLHEFARYLRSRCSCPVMYKSDTQLCHDNGVMHRNLKPENFLLVNKSEESPLKAIDFGLSVYFKHILLCGFPPFWGGECCSLFVLIVHSPISSTELLMRCCLFQRLQTPMRKLHNRYCDE